MALLLSASSPQQFTISTNACWVVKKVRDRNFDEIFEPIEKNPSLVWETNSRGWTCLHIACATTTVPQRWWEWLLYQARAGHEKLRMAETENGQTPVELYFRTNLFPYPWQDRASKESAKQLKDAIKLILGSPHLLEELRLCILDQDETMMDYDSSTDDSSRSSDPKETGIQRVLDFWQRMEFLLTVSFYGRLSMTFRQKLRTELVLAFANLPWCPQVVAELGIRLFPSTGSHASRALEIWASTKSSFERYPEGDCGSLPVLCHYYLFAASTTVPRIPRTTYSLNLALRMGKRWTEVEPLFHLFPDTLNARDQGLPVFCLPAIAPVSDRDVEMSARWGGHQTGVWHYLSPRDKERELVKAREAVDRETIETIYQLLRRNPSALMG